MYQEQLDALTAFATGDPFKDALLEARKDYFSRTGEVFEDDKSFEMRMASFLDYYLFDRPVRGGRTPAQLYLARDGASEGERTVARGLSLTVHSLFEVRKLAPDLVRLRDCFTDRDCDVFERRHPAGLGKGDLLEARLIPVDGKLLFSHAFCFHPVEVKKAVLREIQRRRKADPAFDRRDFIWALSRMRLKFERYRNIAVEDIYAFDRRTI